MTKSSLTQTVKKVTSNFANLEGKAEIYINLEGDGINAIGLYCDFNHIKALLECQGTEVFYLSLQDSLVEDWFDAVMAG